MASKWPSLSRTKLCQAEMPQQRRGFQWRFLSACSLIISTGNPLLQMGVAIACAIASVHTGTGRFRLRPGPMHTGHFAGSTDAAQPVQNWLHSQHQPRTNQPQEHRTPACTGARGGPVGGRLEAACPRARTNHHTGGLSSKGPYLALPNRDTTPVTLMGHYLTWRPNLPYLACPSHCLI